MRFYFHVRDDLSSEDLEGQELASLELARSRAIEGARDIAAEQVRQGTLCLHHRIDICDGSRRLLLSVPFRDAVEVTG